jgi:hypothetical protein
MQGRHFTRDGNGQPLFAQEASHDVDARRPRGLPVGAHPVPRLQWSSRDLVDTLSPRFLGRFKLLRAQAAKVTVAASPIVEAIDVVGHIVQGQLAVLVDMLLDPFLLQTAEEGLRDRIVPAVPLPAHARLQMMRAIEAPPDVAAELGTLIRMNHRAAGTSPAHGHQHGVEDELAVNRRSRRPADDLAREQIQDDGQVEPPLPRPNVGDIRGR